MTHTRIQNLADVYEIRNTEIDATAVRSIDVEAAVDTRVLPLMITVHLIKALGLPRLRTVTAKGSSGPQQIGIFGPVELTIQGRDCRCDVAELVGGSRVIIGRVPLKMLDWVVDPIGQRLIGNLEHGGEQMIELYSVFE